MKKILQLAIHSVALGLIFSFTLICSAQTLIQGGMYDGGTMNVPLNDKYVVSAANFAVVNRRKTEKTASLKLISIEGANISIGQQATFFTLCLKISNTNKEQEASSVVYQLNQKYELKSWNYEKCAPPESARPKISEKDLSGTWEYEGHINKFVVEDEKVLRVITNIAESDKYSEIKADDIDFVGRIQGYVIKGSQTLYLDPGSREACPGMSSTQVNAELTLSKDGKTLSIVRDDPHLMWNTCQWQWINTFPKIVQRMTKR